MKTIFFILLLLFSTVVTFAQEFVSEGIKTARIRQSEKDFSYPICQLGGALELQFDVLDDKYTDLIYSVRHCDCNFEPDDLSFSEFAEGFDFREIDSYENSFNTHQNFTHYTLRIPNNDLKLLISGNYIVTVYEDGDMEKPILRKRFMVYDFADNSKLKAEVSRPFISEYSFDCQQVAVRLKTDVQTKYVKVFAMQNKDFSTMRELEVSGYAPGEILYEKNDGNNLFKGGSEFEFFDCKDVHFRALGIDEIKYEYGLYSYKLSPFKPVDLSYSFQEDLNGAYYIKNDKGFSLDLEADYIKVLFRLKYDRYAENKILIFGEAFDENDEMSFNSESGFWEKEVLLKQGLYNFQFVEKTTAGEKNFLSGSWYNTENDYFFAVYTTLLKDRGDRLMFVKTVNSVKK